MAGRQIPFRPKLEGDFKNRFYQAVSGITPDMSSADILLIAETEISWVENECFYNLEQRKKYRAIWYLLKDLISASYRAEYHDGTLVMSLPSVSRHDIANSSIPEVKATLRSWMAESRHERIVAGKDFVLRMEKSTQTKKAVTDLIADGNELADRLIRAKNGEINLFDAVDPHLELVEENKKDDGYTNQKLSDIWQYFRLMWSSAYENTPGRTIRYLIRDYAHPMHAVMGIASLENCTVQITSRDDSLGWTLAGFIKRIEKHDENGKKAAFLKLLDYIQSGIEGIDYSELCDEAAVANPSGEDIGRLTAMALDAEEKRKSILKSKGEGTESAEKSDLGKIPKEAEIALYRKKRAEQMAKYLSAKMIIQEFINNGNLDEGSLDFCNSDNGSSAIYTALVAQKSKHIGSSMMELNVCGAVPPYNHILGGKLVALLATSPQVVHDYKFRYANKPSEIASRMKGEPVMRPADLVYVGTTSLYYVGSSQYNRLKIPGSVFGRDYDVQWKELGNTFGYGTMHISRTTTMCLNEAVGDDSRLINHVFGEGASPKFRLLTMGVTKLLESAPDADPKEFTKHAMQRIVYGACLAKNTTEYLLGYDQEPIYYTDMTDYETGTQKVIDFWRNRWLKSRLNYEPIYQRIREFDKASLLVSNEFMEDETVTFEELREGAAMPTTGKKEKLNFVRGFYRGTSAFAEHIPADLLSIIHVETKLDDAIRSNISEGKDVVLTGNAGDGKTHIIKILEADLIATGKNPDFMLDASEKSSEEIYARWKNARDNSRPFVIAINAAILFALHEYCVNNRLNFVPVDEAFNLMQQSITFHGESISYQDLVVYDLNERNVLAKDFIKSAIDKLSDDALFEECEECQFRNVCAAQKNRRYIKDSLFQERLCFILNRVALQGYHATLRDLQSLISFLIFADKKCPELGSNAGGDEFDIIHFLYSNDAKGNIFDEIKRSFDPVSVSHPVFDELILKNQISQGGWSTNYAAPVNAISATSIDAFEQRKRQFFFFHKDGQKYIDVNDDIVAKFEAFLSESKDFVMRETIVRKLDCFFETEPSSDLVVWTGHRFDNQPRKVLLSIGSLPDDEFSIGRPKLQSDMSDGFDIVKNYIRFERQISDEDNIFLKIDYGMFELLSQAENGVPVLFMESDLVKKVWRFIEQLQSVKDFKNARRMEFSILDVQTRERVAITMNRRDKRYMKLKIEHRKS